tara:strand:+ start:89 stop:268 length:180 start_codon:yes stop_codon:yes gene_type:complete
MKANFKVIAPISIGLLCILFASLLLIIGNFIKDWPVAVLPVIIGAFFLSWGSYNAGKGK